MGPFDSLKAIERLVQNKSNIPWNGLPELNKEDGTLCRIRFWRFSCDTKERHRDYVNECLSSIVELQMCNSWALKWIWMNRYLKPQTSPFCKYLILKCHPSSCTKISSASSGKLNIPLIKRNLYSTGLTSASNQVSNRHHGSFWLQINRFVFLKQCQKICMKEVFFCGRYNEVNIENSWKLNRAES